MSAPAHDDNHLAVFLPLITTWVESKRSPSGPLNTNVMTEGMTVSQRLGEALQLEMQLAELPEVR